MTNELKNAYHRAWRRKNAEKMRAYNREYMRKWRAANGNEATERYVARYPERERARRLARYAVKSGRLVRGDCEVCGAPQGQGHHDDYSKPLQVRWLCPVHHTEAHRGDGTDDCGYPKQPHRRRIFISGRSSKKEVVVKIGTCSWCGRARTNRTKRHDICIRARLRVRARELRNQRNAA